MRERPQGPPITRAGEPFATQHRARFGSLPDLSSLPRVRASDALLDQARKQWAHRALTEFRSVQIMTRFLEELLGAAEPLDVYAGAVDMIQEELRHAELCAAVCEALGGTPRYPHPARLADSAAFLDTAYRDRALVTAVTMLAINETISVAYITDLAERCTQPAIATVLREIIADEATHDAYGWSYIRRAVPLASERLQRELPTLLKATIAPHDAMADRVLEQVPPERRALEAWPDPDEIELGLFSQPRQALVYLRARDELLLPALARHGLVPAA
ncbi:MAG: ferritin-like domain-containing protein [Myxococcota bacterium]|nr:ferritin-like domain-containing protein [Myxococcota bacterium]